VTLVARDEQEEKKKCGVKVFDAKHLLATILIGGRVEA
jgi:hypothetical protein